MTPVLADLRRKQQLYGTENCCLERVNQEFGKEFMWNSFQNYSRQKKTTFASRSFRTDCKCSLLMKICPRKYNWWLVFMVMSPKHNKNLCSGSYHRIHGRKKHVKVVAMSNQRWWFFCINKVFCIMTRLEDCVIYCEEYRHALVRWWLDSSPR